MKKFCDYWKERAKNIFDFEKKKIFPLTKKELKPYWVWKECYICGKEILENAEDINYPKIRYHCDYTWKYRGTAHSICNLKFNMPNEIPVVFGNGSNYDYHFLIKEITNEFDRQIKCLGENKEKYKIFYVSIKKKIIRIDKDGKERIETVSYSMRFMGTSLSKLADNLTEGIHKIKCKDCGSLFLDMKVLKIIDEI